MWHLNLFSMTRVERSSAEIFTHHAVLNILTKQRKDKFCLLPYSFCCQTVSVYLKLNDYNCHN